MVGGADAPAAESTVVVDGNATLPPKDNDQDPDQDPDLEPDPANPPGPSKLPRCNPDEIVALYHQVLPELPEVKLMSGSRRKALGVFWRWVFTSKKTDGTKRAETADKALVWIRQYFERARLSDFLMGRLAGNSGGRHEGWRCDIDYLLTERGKRQVIEKTAD